MNNKLIIGFGGLKFAGKTTAAKALQRMFAEEAVVMSFATPVKQICKDLFLLSDEQVCDPELKEQVDCRWGRSPRQLMQLLGTDFVRHMIDDTFWVKRLENTVRQSDKRVILIDDIRFSQEAKICDYLFMIHRKDTVNDDNHESENPPYHLSFCDIINDCPTVEEYERHVRGGLATRIIQEFIHASSKN